MGHTKNIIKRSKTVTVAPLKLEEYSLLEAVYNKAYGNDAKGVAATAIVKAILHNCQKQYEDMRKTQKENYLKSLVELTSASGGRNISFENPEVEQLAAQIVDKLNVSKRDMAAFAAMLRKKAKKTLVTYDKSK